MVALLWECLGNLAWLISVVFAARSFLYALSFLLLAGILYWLYRKPSKLPFWLCLGFVSFSVATWLSLRWWPSWPRHVWEEMKPLKDAPSEALLSYFHALIYLGSLLVVLVVQSSLEHKNDHGARRAVKPVLAVLIFAAVLVDTCAVNHFIRRAMADEAKESIKKTNTLTTSLLGHKKHQLSSLIIRDQALTKTVSQIYSAIRNDYPEIDVKAVSVHVFPGVPSNQIWNFMQVGRESRDVQHLDYFGEGKRPGSLIAAAIIKKQRFYCADARRPKQLGGDCEYYAPPDRTKIDYIGIACFPILSPERNLDPFAGICIDGGSDYQWDAILDDLETRLNIMSDHLYDLLDKMRSGEECMFEKNVENTGAVPTE